MTNVTVQYFAVFREQAGLDSERLDTDLATVGDLFEQMARQHGFADPKSRCKVAINDELSDWTTKLNEGDRILFFPPVAGG